MTVEDTRARERPPSTRPHGTSRPLPAARCAAGPMWVGHVFLVTASPLTAGPQCQRHVEWRGWWDGGEGEAAAAGGGEHKRPCRTPPPCGTFGRRRGPPRAAAIATHVPPPSAGEDALSRMAAARFASWPGGDGGRPFTPERRGTAARSRRPRHRAVGCLSPPPDFSFHSSLFAAVARSARGTVSTG